MGKAVKILQIINDESVRGQIFLAAEALEMQCTSIEAEKFQLDDLNRFRPDIIFLALRYQNTDGISLCLNIREHPEGITPLVIFISELSDAYLQVASLKAGADDYLNAPVSDRLLRGKLFSWKRRASIQCCLPQAKLQVDYDQFSVRHNEEVFQLPKKEFDIVAVLASKPNTVFTREQIIQAVWSPSDNVSTRTVDVYVRKIRQIVGENVVTTVKGKGYKVCTDC